MINGSGVVGTRELGTIAFFQGDQNLRQADSPTFTGLTINGTASIAYFETLYETSSIIYSSGSTKFGNTMDDFHDFTGSVDITGSIVASNLSGTNTGDQDLSSYSTIVQLNASSSALQTNIDAKASITQLNASSSALQSNIDGKQDTLTFGKSSGNALKSEEALTTNDVLLMGSSNVKGRTYSEFRGDINVEDGADVTDTTNVTAAGALMDSEVTNLAQVKAFDSSDYATAAQGTKADTAIQPSQTSSFSTATGVEDNADVTDTTNVTAAGALMDSEVTNLSTS